MEELREKAIKESEEAAKKPRFGLFSHPPPICVGDDSAFQKLLPRLDADRKVVIEKRGIFVPTGAKNTFFGKFPKFAVPTDQPGESLTKGKKATADEQGKSERPPFYPSVKKWNEYQTEKGKRQGQAFDSFPPELAPPATVHKDAEGKVTVGARGIYTQCTKVGPIARPFGSPYPVHLPANPPPRKRAVSEAKSSEERAFISTAFPRPHFTKDRELFFHDYGKIRKKSSKVAAREAAVPFRPSHPTRSGSQGFFQRVVPAMDPRPQERARPKEKESKKERFRPTHAGLTTPTPSVLLMNALRA